MGIVVLRRVLVRALMTAVAATARRMPWRTVEGVVGIVVTPGGRLVLVRHTYVRGWFPPGGGRKRRESPLEAVLRELREEIGLSSWSSIEPLEQGEATIGAFVIRGAVYRPTANLEIEAVREFEADRLPPDASPRLVAIVSRMRRNEPSRSG